MASLWKSLNGFDVLFHMMCYFITNNELKYIAILLGVHYINVLIKEYLYS